MTQLIDLEKSVIYIYTRGVLVTVGNLYQTYLSPDSVDFKIKDMVLLDTDGCILWLHLFFFDYPKQWMA